MQNQQALLTFRLQDSRNRYERIEIQVDGESIGKLGIFEELQLTVSRGRHVITSKSFWKSSAYPLVIEVLDNEEIEITLEPAEGKNKFQFYVETKIPLESQLSEENLKARKLSWDMGREIFVRKIKKACIYFDLRNISYLHALRFEIDLYNHGLKVYANRKQKILLYESRVDYVDPHEATGTRINNFTKHSFYREDGTLLGFLFSEDGNWFISGADINEKLAEICLTNSLVDIFSNQDHYLLSLGCQNQVLTYQKWDRKNVLKFQNIATPAADQHEILMLAFLTFSALSRERSLFFRKENSPAIAYSNN